MSSRVKFTQDGVIVGRASAGGGLGEEVKIFESVANSAARKTLATYNGASIMPGLTVVLQADEPDTIWLLVGSDVTLDASWKAITTDSSGESIATMLGCDTFANLAAANAALSPGTPYWDTALGRLNITTA